MTRSIFDPTGPDTERSGSRNLGPDAGNLSHMPSDVTDGDVTEEETAEYRAAGLEPPAPPSDTIDMGDLAPTSSAAPGVAPGMAPGVAPGAAATDAGKSTNPDGLLAPEDDLSNPGRDARA